MVDNQKNPFARYVQHETPSGGGENPFAQYQQQAAPAQRPRRTLTQAATDTGRSLASGVGTVISGLGTVGGLVTGRPDNAVSQFGDSVREYWQEGQSDQLKYDRQQRQAAIDQADGVLGKAGTAIRETVTNPSLFVDTVAETAASMIPAGAAGRVGAMVSGARALSRGATPAQAAQRATRVGTAAGVGTGAVQAGGDVSGGVYADSMALDDTAWQRNPDYVARVEAGEDPDAVKHDLALAASRAAFAGTVPLSVASQFAVPGGATIERAIAGAAGRTGAASPVAARTLNAVRGGLGEAAQEAIEEGGGEFVGNLAERAYVDPETDLGDGVGEGIGLGAVAGFGLGGATGAVQRPRRLTETQPPPNAPEPAAAPEPLALPPPGAVTVDPAGNAATAAQTHATSLQDADFTAGRATRGLTPDVNRARAAHPGAAPNLPDGSPVPNPAAGPLSRAANVGVNNGAVQNAAAERALAAAAEQQQAIERGARGQRQPVTIDGQASRVPSNVNPETGEVVSRDRDEIKAFIHGQLERGNRPPAPNVAAAAWGMKPREAGDLIREVRAERRAALNAEATNAEATQRPESGRGPDAARDAVDAGRDPSPDAAGESVAAVPAAAEADGAPEADRAQAAELTDVDVEETIRGLEVDRADRDHLRDALDKGVSPVDGKPIASEGFRRQWQDELDNLEVSVSEAEDFVRAAGRDPGAPQPQSEIAAAGAEAATSPTSSAPEPTPAQKEAGNYKKGHVRLNGHDISIENPAGSRRRPEWKPLQDAYGYIRGTVGRDKDHVDVFMTDRAGDASLPVFVVDQVDQNGRFDEHKVVMGAATEEEARATYLRNYEDGWTGLGGIRQMTQDEFKTWVRDPEKTARRASPTSRTPTTPSPMESRNTGRPERDQAAAGPQAAQPAAQDPRPAETRTEESAAPTAEQSAEAPRPKMRTIKGKRRYDETHLDTLRAYFQPGRVVPSYMGQDRVIEFRADAGDGRWSVKVQAVNEDGTPRREHDGQEEAPRWHSTMPSQRDLVSVLGPAESQPSRAPAKKAAKKAASRRAPSRADEPYMAQGETAVDRLKKSKPFRAALKKIGDPHIQSEAAFRAAQGWEDAKAGRPADDRNLADTSNMTPGQNPVDHYIGAYLAAKGQEPRVIRARDAAQFYLEHGPDGTGGDPSSGTSSARGADTRGAAERGTGRLFRGTPAGEPGSGVFYTTDRAYAEKYGDAIEEIEGISEPLLDLSAALDDSTPDAFNDERLGDVLREALGSPLAADEILVTIARGGDGTVTPVRSFMQEETFDALRRAGVRAVKFRQGTGDTVAILDESLKRAVNDPQEVADGRADTRVSQQEFDAALEQAKGRLRSRLEQMKGAAFRDPAQAFLRATGVSTRGMRKAEVIDAILATMDQGNAVALRDFGVEVSESVERALLAGMEGRVDRSASDNATPAPAQPQEAAAELAADTTDLPPGVRIQLERFEAGDYERPRRGRGVTMDDYRQAARIFLEGELKAKMPTPSADGIDFNGLSGISPRPIERNVRPARNFDARRKAMAALAPRNDVRYYLNGVHMEPENGRMVVTDGHRAAVVEGVAFADAALPPRQNITDSDAQRTVLGRDGEWIDGRFPPWDRVMPKQHGASTHQFDAARIAALGKGMARVYRYADTRRDHPVAHVQLGGESVPLNPGYLAEAADLFRRFGYSTFEMSALPATGNGIATVYMTSPDGQVRQVIAQSRGTSIFNDIAPDGESAAVGEAASEPEPAAAPTAEPAAEPAAEPTVEQAPDSEATGDAGEELWYNRRNRGGAGLQWADVEGLNDTLKVKEVVKSKVWPRPNYEQLVEDGLRPEFAHLVKQVYDTLATKPRVRGVPTDEQMQDYIAAVGRVREAVFEFVRDNSRVGSALERVIGEARESAAGTVSLSNLGRNDVTILDAVFPMPEGSKSRWRTDGATNENNAIANLIGGNKVVRALQIGTTEFTKAVKAVADGWPAPKEAWQRMYKIRRFSSGYVVSRVRRTLARELESQEAAEAFAKEHYEKSRATDTETAPEARAAEEAQRIGPEHRRPDEDITSERLMETFGFRGVNFGNWMKGDTPAKVRERQIHLNHAYDAMLDLAQLTGLPARAMSLEGKLGIAFGAQGSGGRAAAHFVPGVNEINLTRRTGAGSLAHEWAHALDHYFAVQAGDAAARSVDPFLTQFTQRDRQGLQVRPEIAQAFRKIVNAMQSRPLTEQELKERAERARKATEEHFDRTLTPLRALLEDTQHHVEGADAEQALAEFDALAARLREGDQGEGTVATGRKVKGLRPRTRVDEVVSQTAGQMLGVMRDTLGTSFDEIVLRYVTDADARASVIAYQAERASQAENHIPQTGEVRSDYMREAIALESNSAKRGGGKRYWSTPWELFARAFQSYVIDRLGRDERRNDYLSWPQMSESAVKAAKEMGLLQGDQFPRGAERARINEAFDALLAEIRTEETGDGQVRLFSRPDPLSNPTRAATPAQVQQVVDRITGGWGDNAPRVEVLADAEGLPARAKRDPGYVTAEGFYDDQAGTVYLVAGNIRGGRDRVNRRDLTAAQRAEQVLAHEVVGHYGIEAITGPELWPALGRTLDRMRASGRHADLFAEVDRRYRGANRAIADREAIAVMAEKGVRNSVIDRAIAAVQRFLRSMGLTMRFGEAELRQQLVTAARYVREGARPQAAPAPQADPTLPFARTDIDPNHEVPVVAIAGGVFGDTQRDTGNARRRAQAYLRRARDAGRAIRNDDTGWQVSLSGRSIGELTAFNAGKLNLIAALPRITRVAVLARSEAARQQGEERGRPSIKAFHTLYAPVRVNDELRVARLVVREDVNGKFAYDLQQSDVLEKLNPASSGTPAIGSGAGRNTGSSSVMTVAQLRAAVNAQGRTGWAWSRADPVGSPLFQRWFRDSKVKGADGTPTVVYHGTANEFWAFDVGRLAESTGHMTAPLGFFFDENRRSAERYAENAADGVPADERVIDAYLSIQNPKRMTIDEFQAVEDYDQARSLRAELREQGYDGIHLADQGQWIAFDPSQIKSASENRGTFDPSNSDLRFSQPDTVINAVDSVLGGTPRGVADRLKSMFRSLNPRDLRENTRPAWLGALTLRHLAELGKDINLTQLDNYAGRVQRMATDRNIMQEDASDTADKWEKFIGKDRAGADATSNLMHDTTIAGVDPSIDYQPLFTGTTKRGGNEPVTAESIARRKALIEKDLKQATSATARQRLHEESAALDAMLEQERKRREAYPGLVQRFQALPEAGQQLYVEVRDAYTRQSDKMLEALVARIGALELDGHQKQALITQVRQQFESARLNGPYFPLQRFGDFWINAEDSSGEPAFMMYERVQDWREAQRELKAQGYKIKNAGRKLDEARSLAGASGGFMADLQGVLEQAGVDSDTRDEVYQLYLRTLPELSVRKHQIHRKAVAGYSKDALRAFSANMFHGSFQIARLMHTHELEADLLAMKKAVDNMTADDPERALKAAALYTEANKRHEWVMNPRDSTVANTLTSLGFAWFLGTTPAAALVNLSQTAIVTYPVLAARFGAGKAFTALSQGMGRAMRNVDGNLTRGLNEEERAAFKIWYQSGAIDRSQAHNLAGLSETDTQAYSSLQRKSMHIISWMFHTAEVVNRESSALAAFRLAREAGQSFNEATKYAEDVVIETHFDYSNANRSRWIQSNTAKVLLLFRQHSLNMTWFLWRNLYLSMRGQDPAVRREAQKKMAGVLGMTGIFAGALGMPAMSVIFGIANAAAAAFGDDDDDPFEAEVEFRNFLVDMLGVDAARVIARGPVDYLTGAAVSGRVSLNELWLREPQRDLEGKAMANYLLEQSAGPIFGGMLVSTLRGLQQIGEGHTWRGVETMMPKALKDGMKAIRFSTEGVNTLRGDPVIEDLTVGESLLQLAGFSPARLNERYDGINAAKNFEERLMGRRSTLLNAYAMAWRAGDTEGVQKVMEKIRAFNAAQPALAISTSTIRQSLQTRMRYSSRAEGGVVLNARVAPQARQQARFAE